MLQNRKGSSSAGKRIIIEVIGESNCLIEFHKSGNLNEALEIQQTGLHRGVRSSG